MSLFHGRIIDAKYAPNHQADFDFAKPPYIPASRPRPAPDKVILRYLGVGGLYVEWRGRSLMTAPFFSNHGLLRAGFGAAGWDEDAIARGLSGLPVGEIGALLSAHSHYDHLADLPHIMERHATAARLYLNMSGANILAPFEALWGRLTTIDERRGQWIRLRDGGGRELPVRMMPLPSEHAGHFWLYHYGKGEVSRAWESWEGKKLHHMKEGRVFTLLIDLLSEDGGRPEFRILYQDAPSSAPAGFPPEEVIAEKDVDLAVLCLPTWWLVDDYPRGILERTRARHVLAIHYEDFFRSTALPTRFVGTCTDRRANRFMEMVEREMSSGSHDPASPSPPACGPSSDAWTMPLPGEWLRFRTGG
jgi:L-ascorbate metabolism protein UlaG (beta-lactamase superfamily)